MTKSAHYKHGGNLNDIERTYGIVSKKLVDFSANVNPLGISPKAKVAIIENVDIISKYPDVEYDFLKQSLANYIHASTDNILVGNGSTELISDFIQFVTPRKALILGPTYSEYEREIDLAGGTVQYYPLKEELNFQLDIEHFLEDLSIEYDLLVLCNPNNPTGTAIPLEDLNRILNKAKEHHVYVLIDETYIEFSDHPEDFHAVPLVEEFDNLFVIRGISKFFSAPGLRVGYAICSNPKVKGKINQNKKPWSINSIAALAVPIMLQDAEYIQNTQHLIAEQRQYFYKELKKIPALKIYESQSNFILCKILNNKISSSDVFKALLQQHLLIRDASSFPFLDSSYIRFCFMNREENVKLVSRISQLLL